MRQEQDNVPTSYAVDDDDDDNVGGDDNVHDDDDGIGGDYDDRIHRSEYQLRCPQFVEIINIISFPKDKNKPPP